MEYGLIGAKLGHSYSARIHRELADYEYELHPLPEEAAARDFLARRDFKAINVTIPYKQLVIPYCDVIDDAARAIGAVNTVVNRNGRLEGHNTDYAGFLYLLHKNKIELKGRTVMILGTGGTCKTVHAAAKALGAKEIFHVSRHSTAQALTYEEARGRKDVQVIINTTPAGMYPENGACLTEPADFPALEAAADVIYNPLKTEFLLRCEACGVKTAGGLLMLTAQAKYAAEYFTGRTIPDTEIDRIEKMLRKDTANLVLIGMPSCGKSTAGRLLASAMGRRFIDLDAEIEKRIGGPVASILSPGNETPFRDLESRAAADFGKEKGLVIATGGGAVLRSENVHALRQNGVLLWLDRPLCALQTGGARPLSGTKEAVRRLYEERCPVYAAVCDARIENNGTIEAAVRAAREAFDEISDS